VLESVSYKEHQQLKDRYELIRKDIEKGIHECKPVWSDNEDGLRCTLARVKTIMLDSLRFN